MFKRMTNFNKKFIIILIIIFIYTLFLTLYDDNDFTGLLKLEEKIDKIQNKNNENINIEKDITNYLDIFMDRLSFVLVTLSTVGYGDIVPKKKSLRIINSLVIILLIYITFN